MLLFNRNSAGSSRFYSAACAGGVLLPAGSEIQRSMAAF
jgi:hypothetical protein